MAYSTYEDWKNGQGMARTQDWQDYGQDGTDDRDQAGNGMPHFRDQYIADGYTPGMAMGQGPSASEPQPPTNNPSNGNSAPQTPSNNVSDTTPDPQEFADQKKQEVKQSYSTSKADRINNAYKDHYGRDAHSEEIDNWMGTGMGIEDIQSGLKTSYARDGDQSSKVKQSYSTSKRDRINNAYKDHYGRNADPEEISNWMGTGMGIEDIQKGLKTSFGRDGEHLTGDALANLQFGQEPSEPAPQPTPEPTPPPTDEERLADIDERFAGSNAFYKRLEESNSPITPDNNQKYNNSNSNSNSGNNANSNTNNNGATSSFNSSYSDGNYSSNYTMNSGNNHNQFDGQQNLENMRKFNKKVKADKGFLSQPNQFQGAVLAMEDAKRGSGFNPMQMAQQAINFNDDNNPINGRAVGQQIDDMIQNFKDERTLIGVRNWGDRDMQKPLKWADRRPTEEYTPPNFAQIAADQQEKIKDIYN